MVNIWVLGRNGSIRPWLNNVPIKTPTNTDNKAIRKSLMSPSCIWHGAIYEPTFQAPCQARLGEQFVKFLDS
jgi:hypothetical protein